MKNIFIIGSKGIPSNYGGFETFVEKLTAYKQNTKIKYHIACLADNDNEFEYNTARCFNIKVPNIGPAKAVFYDIKALDAVYKYIKNNKLHNSIVYILACRIGPFIRFYKKRLFKYNTPIYVNPDGHEWKRAKWNKFIRQYWKYSERLMVKNSDLMICDSRAIENYILKDYIKFKPNTTFIAYGANLNRTENDSVDRYKSWVKKWGLVEGEYFLIVGRMVPENNYELMINEFLNSETKRHLVIVTKIENSTYYEKLKERVKFQKDSRVKFVGTIYDQDLLYEVRRGSFAYLHGHEVGGTNPSLLEALATTAINILLDVEFNREVARDAAIYFTKTKNSLVNAIKIAEGLTENDRESLSYLSKERIKRDYSWDLIIDKYESVFLGSEEE